MKTTNRKPLIALIALSAALAMPLAFAQDDAKDPQNPQPTPLTSPCSTAQVSAA